MNEHLTPAQIDALLIGDTNPEAAQHLAACPTCTAEFAATRSSLAHLSEALTCMAQQERFRRNTQATILNFRATPTGRPVRRMTFALAATIALAAAILPFTHMAAPPATKAPVAAPTSTVQSDEALLNEIDQQLSASVPQALAPLEDPSGSQATHSNPNPTDKKD
jgi:hypothetical protein